MAQKYTHYEVLQVSRSASTEQIAEAYRELAKQYHPDLHPTDPNASKRFKRLTKAYDVLSDPERRAKYDEKLARRERAANRAAEPPPAPEENTGQANPQEAEPHPEQQRAENATHHTATQSVSILRSWIIALKHVLLRLLSFLLKPIGDTRFPYALVVFIFAVVGISAFYFVMTYETADDKVRRLLATAEDNRQQGNLVEAIQLAREATNIEGANKLIRTKSLNLTNVIEAEQRANEARKAGRTIKFNDVERLGILEEHYKDGRKDGLSVAFHENGRKLFEYHYKNGERSGPYTWWHENGKKASEGHWKNDKQDGLETSWHENGKKASERHWKNDKPDGPRTEWHGNGVKTLESHWNNGVEDGLWTEWQENGRKIKETHYRNGKKDGHETWWYVNGEKRREIHYKDGKVVSRKNF